MRITPENGKLLCLNMIVRNEMANIERCLRAVADYIACWVIGDTGSTDGTEDFIKSFFGRRNIPGELHSFPFENFEQARNAALDRAYASSLNYDYLLLADADMELVVEYQGFRERLEAPGYRLLQRSPSDFAYWNTRIVQRTAGARYHGVTHEYIDVPGGVRELTAVWYKDHASGSNRVDKFERDIKLLTAALGQDPENHRHWFYLAQSFRDAGRTAEAAKAYAKRAEMGGWEEEAWQARMQEARCLRTLGDEAAFLRQALVAFNQRPQRAEPLYDLARFYREKGMNDASLLFSEAGLGVGPPKEDILFVEDFIYTAGLEEEFSIAANYARDPARKDRGFAACNRLALNRQIPVGSRDLARSNLFFYLQSASTIMPSFVARPIGFHAPDGYWPIKPSVARQGQQIMLVQPCVNDPPTDGGPYLKPTDAPIHTRNFLLSMSDEVEIQSATEILPPVDMPAPQYGLVLGFENLRLFTWRDELWGSSCVRELTPEGWCEQVLARIDSRRLGECRLSNWRVLHPEGPRRHEKNWMPKVGGGNLQFIYRCDPTQVVDEQARTVFTATASIAAERFSGGSQAIAFDGGWLALIHEAQLKVSDNKRSYHHRFVWFDEASTLRRVSRPFFFQKKGVEFAAGMAWHPDGQRLLISYSVGDEGWIGTIDTVDIRAVLEDVERIASGPLKKGGGERTPAAQAVFEPSEQASKKSEDHDNEMDQAATGQTCVVSEPKQTRAVPTPLVIEQREAQGSKESSLSYITGRSKQAELHTGHIAYGSPPRLFTSHGTVSYVDPASGELRHGPIDHSPANAGLVADEARGRLVHEKDGVLGPIVCLPNLCLAFESQRDGPHSFEPTVLELVQLGDGRIGLKAQGKFLCAEADGRLTLSRNACSTWESFKISDREEPRSTGEIFVKLAPFLRAADSPQERRRLSREFDARIASFINPKDSASLPQIHCFYEVLSDKSDHRTLVAATTSMRAAGHPVRVWSYSPQKLEFLLSHGVELRAADDVIPRELFERILAGSEIRYFSDLFRYAVLYEHGGLWMDSDVILLRPFPFRGDHFFNLQWRSDSKNEHFVCGNVMYAEPYSRHIRSLYETSINQFFEGSGRTFGDAGPKLLSDYIASDAGAELRDRVFSPMFFNPIDWTEIDKFDKPISELADYLNDERVFGIHLWTARNEARARVDDSPLISVLSEPLSHLPSFTNLAERFNTDKNRHTGNGHFYARIYDRLLSSRRLSMRRLMEIGLCRGLAERNQSETPSVALWQTYFPFCQVIGVDLTDFSALNNERFTSFVCDQSKRDELREVAAKLEPGSLDVIIDDGSHASFDEQLTLCEFFPLLAPGGWYFIEDLDWQPPGEDQNKITTTKRLLLEIKEYGAAQSIDPLGVTDLSAEFADILFFDSHYELRRAHLLCGLVAIRKRGEQVLSKPRRGGLDS